MMPKMDVQIEMLRALRDWQFEGSWCAMLAYLDWRIEQGQGVGKGRLKWTTFRRLKRDRDLIAPLAAEESARSA